MPVLEAMTYSSVLDFKAGFLQHCFCVHSETYASS